MEREKSIEEIFAEFNRLTSIAIGMIIEDYCEEDCEEEH